MAITPLLHYRRDDDTWILHLRNGRDPRSNTVTELESLNEALTRAMDAVKEQMFDMGDGVVGVPTLPEITLEFAARIIEIAG